MKEDIARVIGASVILAGLMITLVLLLILGRVKAMHQEMNIGMEEMRIKVEQRDQLDSLYREHLDKCSFISQDEVEVDSRGYLYSKYRNNPLHVEEHAE